MNRETNGILMRWRLSKGYGGQALSFARGCFTRSLMWRWQSALMGRVVLKNLLSAQRVLHAELNGFCKTTPLGDRTPNEVEHALANYPNLYRRVNGRVLLVPSGPYFPTMNIQKPGFGGGSFFDPNAQTDKRMELK